ncbi:hypothetical protein Mesil_2646 [Allomeiothermus silvanus DSM 9946]|uniref:Uncharacterized protein n=1 Tax=Allomeiothermus silvanus (strain ATCC 700542 / DSM 9946 / NBRC 106475 / NCIMB 13440 / VI-R2) TaxID=526227 RepID=D7BBN3_ALLS1|nr:hypothetical protein [Allomeiothermus silvanus]ADH64495.1 hypothetical protein Mesil_2646 [Allomeiothermus silvanus DSM 9946]
MDVVNNWQALERLSRDHIDTLLAETYFRGVSREAYFRGLSREASRGVSRVAEQNQHLLRLSLRRRIARWLKEWAEKLESDPSWEGKASYG